MKKWFKKIGAMLLAGAMAALLFAGCSSDADVTIDVNALADDLRSSVTFNDDITKIDDAGIAMLYKDLDADLVVNQAVYASSGASTEEIGVFEAADAAGAEQIKTAVEARIQSQIDGYSDYGPDQVPRLNDTVLQTVGKYVIFCASDHNDQAEAAIEKYTK